MRSVYIIQLALLSLLAPLALQADIGPFRSPSDLELAKANLAAAGISLDEDVDQTRESLGFIVVSERLGEERSTEMLDQLRDQSIRDIVYVGLGVYEGRVSAGVFTSASAARQRLAELPQEQRRRFEVAERSRIVEFSAWLRGDTASVADPLLSALEDELGYTLQRTNEVTPAIQPATQSATQPATQPDPVSEPPAQASETDSTPAMPASRELTPIKITAAPYPSIYPLTAPSTAPSIAPSPAPSKPPEETKSQPAETAPLPNWLILMSILFLVLIATGLFALHRATASRRGARLTTRVITDHVQEAPETPDAPEKSITPEPPEVAEVAEVPETAEVPEEREPAEMSEAPGEPEAAETFAVSETPEAAEAAEAPEPGGQDLIDAPHPFDQVTDLLLTNLPVDRSQVIQAMSRNPGHQTLELLRDLIEISAHQAREGVVFDPETVITRVVANAESQFPNASISHRTTEPFPLCEGDIATLDRVAASALSLTLALDQGAPTTLGAELTSQMSMLSLTVSNETASPARADSMTDMRLTTLSRLLEQRDGALTISHLQDAGLRLTITLPVSIADADRVRLANGESVQAVIDARTAAEKAAGEAAAQAEETAESLRLTSRHLEEEIETRKRAEETAATRVATLKTQLAGAQSRALEASKKKNEQKIDAEFRIQGLKEKLGAAETRVSETELRIHEATQQSREQIEQLTRTLDETRANHDHEIEEIRRTAAASAEELESLAEKLRQSETALAAARADRESTEARMAGEITALEERLEAVRAGRADSDAQRKAETESLSQELTDARRRLADLQSETESLDRQAQEVEALSEAKSAAETAHQNEHARLQAALAERDLEISSLWGEIDSLQAKRDEEAATLETLRDALAKAEDQLARQIESNKRANNQAAAEISRLMDESNKARSAVTRATSLAEQIDALTNDVKQSRLAADEAEAARRQAEALVEELTANKSQESEARDAELEALVRQLDSVKQKWSSERWARRKLQQRQSSSPSPAEKRRRSEEEKQANEMAATFDERLPSQLDALARGIREEDLSTIVEKATWIKSEVAARNQHDLKSPLAALETGLREKDNEAALAAIGDLREAAASRQPAAQASEPEETESLTFQLPNKPLAAEQMQNFVTLLGTRLLELEGAADKGDLTEVKRTAIRLQKYAAGFGMAPVAERFGELAGTTDRQTALSRIDQLMNVYSLIELVATDNAREKTGTQT